MKRSNLLAGVLCLIAAIACFFVALFTESKLDGLLFAFSAAAIIPGAMMICRYFYWSSPENKARYEERLDNERIEQHDELKMRIRDKAGLYAYALGLLVTSISVMVFGILGKLEIVNNYRTIVLYLSGYLVFQIAALFAIHSHLIKKY